MSTSGPAPMPVSIRKEGENHLVIDWNDGRRCEYTWTYLRNNCPCASCREERQRPPDPFRVLKPAELGPLRAVYMRPVGRYAYQIAWSDGHDTGIYTLELLRALCTECPETK